MSANPTAPIGPSGMELAAGVYVPWSAVRFGTARSSGPGGQNVNKLNTKVELWIPVSAIVGLNVRAAERLRAAAGKRLTRDDQIHLWAQSARSQETNRAAVIQRLREMVSAALHEPKPRRKTRATQASKRRRRQAKQHRSHVKQSRRFHGEQ